MPVVDLEVGDGGRQPGNQALDRQRFEDDAGGERQHLRITNTEHLRHGGTSGLGRLKTGFASAGIGDAGIDNQRTNPAVSSQMAPADLHRCGTEAVLGKYAGNGGAGI